MNWLWNSFLRGKINKTIFLALKTDNQQLTPRVSNENDKFDNLIPWRNLTQNNDEWSTSENGRDPSLSCLRAPDV